MMGLPDVPAGGLAGRRLVLRPLEAGDALTLYALIDASRSALRRRLRWVDDVHAIADVKGFVGRAAATSSGGALVLGVFEAKAGRCVGVAALQGLAEGGQVAELGGWIGVERRGRGYACEAGKALVGQAFRKWGLRRLYARIDPANRDGRRVLQKLGFRYEGCLRREKRLNGRWVDQECWGLLKEEWIHFPPPRGGK
ncbi:MAG: GNAT family N-acetyltransferase [Elusimicrobia bacterium]|nr:GNAT family N-acetyltransferase [Elusimicrobiota bacterium]